MPYAPGISYDFSPLFAGIARAGQNISDAVKQYRNDKQEGEFLNQRFEGLAQAVGEQDPSKAPDLAKFAGMSLSQKRGKLASLAFEYDRMQKDADRSLRERQVAATEGQLDVARAAQQFTQGRQMLNDSLAADERGRAQNFMRTLSEGAAPGPFADGLHEGGNLTLQDIVKAAGQSGYDLPPNSLMHAIQVLGKGSKSEPLTKQVGSNTVLFSPDTGAFHVMPSEDMTPGQRKSYVSQLQDHRRRLLATMADQAKFNPEFRQVYEAELQSIADELAQYGVKVPAFPSATAAPAAAAPAPGGKRLVFTKDGQLTPSK